MITVSENNMRDTINSAASIIIMVTDFLSHCTAGKEVTLSSSGAEGLSQVLWMARETLEEAEIHKGRLEEELQQERPRPVIAGEDLSLTPVLTEPTDGLCAEIGEILKNSQKLSA
jgi:hypothetical protein